MQGIVDQIICICMSSLKDHNGSANKGKKDICYKNLPLAIPNYCSVDWALEPK